MDEETIKRLLEEVLKEQLKPIKKDILDLKDGQLGIKNGTSEIKDMMVELEATNATRHTQISLKLEELKELKQVTKENCYDIAKLKAIK